MNKLTLALLPALGLLASCASFPPGPAAGAPSCEHVNVPPGAVFSVQQGRQLATYPPSLAPRYSGCQRVWHGDRTRPETMEVMATYYYEAGHVKHLIGRVPGGAPYECHYVQGELDARASRNPGLCPKASELQGLR